MVVANKPDTGVVDKQKKTVVVIEGGTWATPLRPTTRRRCHVCWTKAKDGDSGRLILSYLGWIFGYGMWPLWWESSLC